MTINKKHPIIAWWSGGIASAIVCKICIDWFGAENVKVVFIDTKNEHPDTYRFLADCEKWYGVSIEVITNKKYSDIYDVWFDFLSLNVAKGAVCSSELKKKVRQDYIKIQPFSHHAFGFDITEMNRAKDMLENNYHLRPIFPLIALLLDKKACMKMLKDANNMFLQIQPPTPYLLGLSNNNCFRTGCVQGGIGYWQWMQKNEPEKFDKMAVTEHQLTDLKGKPVTILKDQSKDGGLVFLKPHPKYPTMKDISMMKGIEPETLIECNGFCDKNN